jgi:hypothetical protein
MPVSTDASKHATRNSCVLFQLVWVDRTARDSGWQTLIRTLLIIVRVTRQ